MGGGGDWRNLGTVAHLLGNAKRSLAIFGESSLLRTQCGDNVVPFELCSLMAGSTMHRNSAINMSVNFTSQV
jgi:hypothetical protein